MRLARELRGVCARTGRATTITQNAASQRTVRMARFTYASALHKKYGVSDPLPLTRLSPFSRGRIHSLILLGLLSPLQRGTAAVGGRGSLTPYFLCKAHGVCFLRCAEFRESSKT